jgi:hypothetical protein
MKARLAHLLAHKLPQWRDLLGAVMSAFPGKFPRWILRSVERDACIGLSPELGEGRLAVYVEDKRSFTCRSASSGSRWISDLH